MCVYLCERAPNFSPNFCIRSWVFILSANSAVLGSWVLAEFGLCSSRACSRRGFCLEVRSGEVARSIFPDLGYLHCPWNTSPSLESVPNRSQRKRVELDRVDLHRHGLSCNRPAPYLQALWVILDSSGSLWCLAFHMISILMD